MDNKNPNEYFNNCGEANNYINFNQFISHYNINSTPEFDYNYIADNFQNDINNQNIFQPQPRHNQQQIQQQHETNQNPNYQEQFIAENSVLTPTAAEFVPSNRRYGNDIQYNYNNALYDNRFSYNQSSNSGLTHIENDYTGDEDLASANGFSEHNDGITGAIRKSYSNSNVSKLRYNNRISNRQYNRNYDEQRYNNDLDYRDERLVSNMNNITKSRKKRYYDKEKNERYSSAYDNEDRYEVDSEFNQKNNHNSNANAAKKINELNKVQLNTKYTQREKLIREIDNGKLECLICCDNIKTFQSIWPCHKCYHIFHLNCIKQWANTSTSKDGWRCPACQNITEDVPKTYFCYCGKVKNPVYNRNDVAHSCGELCQRSILCEHPCTLLCHPGPCPPCQATVTRFCGCGKTQKALQCSQKQNVECQLNCDKLMNCGVHTCLKKCHVGDCNECDIVIEHNCYCGKSNKTVPCTKENNKSLRYSCEEVCNKDLTCKNHKCAEICHEKGCNECKLSPQLVTTCPCGKVPIEEGSRKSCLDPIILCNNNCHRPLKCGPPGTPHVCTSRCHIGTCSPCNKQTSFKCRCGNMNINVKCKQLPLPAEGVSCKKRCTKKRNCGKHKCNQECCIDKDHICPLPCPYTLFCGKHKCDQTCHKGRCLPCFRSSFEELYCECGANVIYPPVPCGTKRPACDKPCSRQHDCDHAVLHNCHSTASCPPCMVLTTKYCYGKHEQRKTIPCSQSDFSCGLPCNKPLKCGRHNCIKACHSGICLTGSDICKQNCTKLRIDCGHKCMAPCHEGLCPDTQCKENVEIQCQCGNRKQTKTCHDFSNEYRRIATSQLASSMQQMQLGNSIDLCDILGPIKVNGNNKTLECNEDCRMIERNRRLDICLQIRNPDLTNKLHPRYSDFLRGWAKKDPNLIKSIHEKLTQLVKLAKDSKQRSRSYSFPTMNREKRQVVHEMCGMFGIDSVAYDAEPNRNVVATAHRERTWLPGMSIMEVLQRESGQRRIPVPNLNARLKK